MTQSITVYEAAKILKTTPAYVRVLIRRKKISGRLANTTSNAAVYLIDRKSVASYQPARKSPKQNKKK